MKDWRAEQWAKGDGPPTPPMRPVHQLIAAMLVNVALVGVNGLFVGLNLRLGSVAWAPWLSLGCAVLNVYVFYRLALSFWEWGMTHGIYGFMRHMYDEHGVAVRLVPPLPDPPDDVA